MDNLIFNVDRMEDDKIRVVISDMNLNQKGVLYFEKVKVGFVRKPISMSSWACVDAKIEDQEIFNEEFTPKQMVGECQDIIKLSGY